MDPVHPEGRGSAMPGKAERTAGAIAKARFVSTTSTLKTQSMTALLRAHLGKVMEHSRNCAFCLAWMAMVLQIPVQAASGPPVITVQPTSQSAHVGEQVTFSVQASGDAPLIFQWWRNGNAIAGTTVSAYTTPPLTRSRDGAVYSVTVINAF